jgi:hypothetical protein
MIVNLAFLEVLGKHRLTDAICACMQSGKQLGL